MAAMRLLLIEDEAKLGEYLRKGLAEESYTVDVATNGIDGLHLAMELDYDLVVLDGRQYRSDQPCGKKSDIGGDCAQRNAHGNNALKHAGLGQVELQ